MHSARIHALLNDSQTTVMNQTTAQPHADEPSAQVSAANRTDTHELQSPVNSLKSTSAAASAGVLVGLLLARR